MGVHIPGRRCVGQSALMKPFEQSARPPAGFVNPVPSVCRGKCSTQQLSRQLPPHTTFDGWRATGLGLGPYATAALLGACVRSRQWDREKSDWRAARAHCKRPYVTTLAAVPAAAQSGFEQHNAEAPQRSRHELRHAAALRLLCEQIGSEKADSSSALTSESSSSLPGLGRAQFDLDVDSERTKSFGSTERVDIDPQLHIPKATAVASAKVDEAGYQRWFMYDPSGSPVPSSPILDCAAWDVADPGARRQLIESAVNILRESGYVVLERLLPADQVKAAGEEFRRYKDSQPEGVTFSRMRAQRDMTIPPFEGVWTEDWLVRHPLVMALLARHLRNSLDTSNEKAAEIEFAHWVSSGASLDHFQTGQLSAGFPLLDLMVVVDTAAGAPAQTRHRDTILPGPCASLGVHIPLTPLQLEPMNGPIGFTPGSHKLFFEDGQKRDVVGAAPLGSVILYDSFTEHHGLENDSKNPRAALFSWYRVPGVYTGHTDENFGQRGLELTMKFRRHLRPALSDAFVAEQHQCPGSASRGPNSQWGFSEDAELAEWGEEKVCFRCNCTNGLGSFSQSQWFCEECWEECRRDGLLAPEAAHANVAPPLPDEGRLTEERLVELEGQGLNIRPSRGRHKLTLLRERGLFLPIDPGSAWLSRISTEPQPEGWKNALRKALGEIPRMDGF